MAFAGMTNWMRSRCLLIVYLVLPVTWMHAVPTREERDGRPAILHSAEAASYSAATLAPTPIGQETPVPPSPQ